MNRVLATSLVLVALCYLSEGCSDSSALDSALRPLYGQLEASHSQLEIMKLQLDAVKSSMQCPCRALDSEWQLVFKGVAGTGVKLFEMWTTTSWHSGLEVGGSWRNNALHEAWRGGTLKLGRVKLSVYDNSEIRAELIFNGTGSDIKSWFTRDRLISSPWQDLKFASTNFFSVDGHLQEDRRFFINQNYAGCPSDHGWLVVTESQALVDCEWERESEAYPYPIILYSATTGVVRWHDVLTRDGLIGRADYLTIHVDSE